VERIAGRELPHIGGSTQITRNEVCMKLTRNEVCMKPKIVQSPLWRWDSVRPDA
jgi:hypothetical protein